MKSFKQFVGEAYSKSERNSHIPPSQPQTFTGLLKKQRKNAGPMAPMPQISPGGNIPLYKGRQIGPKFDKNPSDFADKPFLVKTPKKTYHTNMPIINNPPTNRTTLEV